MYFKISLDTKVLKKITLLLMFENFQVKHERLFVVSVLGFIVNLVGIYAFQHGHSHGGGHGHSHQGGSSNHGKN